MKTPLAAIAIGVVMAFAPQQAEAQFFKKLSKALDDVSKTVDKVLGTDSDASQSASSTSGSSNTGTQTIAGGAKLKSTLPGFSVEYKDIVWYQDFVSVDFFLTNNSSKEQTVYSFNRLTATTASGQEVEVGSLDDGTPIYLNNCDITFKPRQTKRISFSLFGLPTSGMKMNQLKMRTTMHEGSKGYVDYPIELTGVTIPAKGSVPTGADAFTGVWTCGRVLANFDIAASGIEDPNAMDAGEACQGTIKLTDEKGNSTYYTIFNAKVTGSKCTFKINGDFTNDNASGSAELLSDKGMVLRLPVMRATMDGRSFEGQYITPSAGPFCGAWQVKGNGFEAFMRLNAYDKSLSMPVDGGLGKGFGIVWLTMGQQTDECHITDCAIRGNVATIWFDSDRSGGKHKATLTYDPSTRTITVGNVSEIGSGAGECYLSDGLKFKK